MDIYTFQARTIQEALQMVRESLGPQAVVLSTKPVVRPTDSVNNQTDVRWIEVQAQAEIEPAVEPFVEYQEATEEVLEAAEQPAYSSMTLAESYIESLYRQEQLEILEQQRVLQQRRDQTPEQFIPSGIWNQLSASTIELNLLREVLRRVGEQGSEQQYQTEIIEQFKTMIPFQPFQLPVSREVGNGPKVIVVTGRSGSGKSSLITKLATQCELRDEVPVGVIELTGPNRHHHAWLHNQLEKLGVPTTQLDNPLRLNEALQPFQHCQVVFIESPGIAASQPQKLAILNSFFKQGRDIQCIFTHDVNARTEPTVELVQTLNCCDNPMLALTKTDEENSLGHLVSLFQQIQLPVTLLSHSAGLADGFTMMTEAEHLKLLERMTGLLRESMSTNSLHTQDSFTLSFNPM